MHELLGKSLLRVVETDGGIVGLCAYRFCIGLAVSGYAGNNHIPVLYTVNLLVFATVNGAV